MGKQYLNLTNKTYYKQNKQNTVYFRDEFKLKLCFEPDINSCYGSGVWLNSLPYIKDDAWLNK